MCRVQFQLAAPVTPGLASVTQQFMLRRFHRALADRGLTHRPGVPWRICGDTERLRQPD